MLLHEAGDSLWNSVRQSKLRRKLEYSPLFVKKNQSERPIASSVVLVPPIDFGYNPETAQDNTFMEDLASSSAKIDRFDVRDKAMVEFDRLARNLYREGIDVKVFPNMTISNARTYDACFPNNWFSTHRDGDKSTVIFYPMKAVSRRRERAPISVQKLKKIYKESIDFTEYETKEEPMYLESTGVLIIDRNNKIAYVAASERAAPELAEIWGQKMGYEIVSFSSFYDGVPIYHTNVMLSVGLDWAVICAESIPEDERTRVIQKLESTGKEVIEVSFSQLTNFCCNILELQGTNSRIIAMSHTAYTSFTPEQLATLSKYAKPVPTRIPTIETVGGGSIRCMIAELF